MNRPRPWRFVLAALAVCCLSNPDAPAAAGREKTPRTIFYAGHPGSARERDFVEFLQEHFRKVGKGNLKGFKEDDARGFDVVILDYDGDGFKSPTPDLGRRYSRATVTIGVTGAHIGGRLRLKTGYL